MSFLDEIIDPTLAPRHIEQGTEEWDKIRCGRFTSSEFHKLMKCGFREMTAAELKARPKTGKGSKTTRMPDPSKMGDDGMNYIYQKVAETLTGHPKQDSYAYPLVWGREQEEFAVDFFTQKTGLLCESVGFIPWSDHAGGSPDRFVGDDAGLEIKCPFYSEHQVKYLMLNDRFDLKRNHPDYYWQIVTLMLFTNRKRWHFCTFDGRMKSDKHKMAHLIITWDQVEEDIDAITKALEGAIKMKLELIDTLSK